MKLASRIKNIREKLQLKQSYVALKLNISQQRYSAIEIQAKDASYITLQNIAGVFEVDVHFIINDDIPITDFTIAAFQKTKVADMVNKNLSSKILIEM